MFALIRNFSLTATGRDGSVLPRHFIMASSMLIGSWSKMLFPVNFRSISREVSAEVYLANFYRTKRFVFEFQGESLEQFLSYRAHFAVISILEDFGSLLPPRPEAVKLEISLC